MSRYCAESIDVILNAVDHWKQRCLVDQLSLFDDEVIWTPEAFEGLRQHFVLAPDAGPGNFFEKLAVQLGNAPRSSQRLALELVWLLYLFPKGSIGPDRKRDNLNSIAATIGYPLATDHWALQNDVLAGIGSAGTYYNTGFWVEFSFAILALQQLVGQPSERRKALMQVDSALAEWLDALALPTRLPSGVALNPATRQFRHIFLFLMQPDRYERISSSANKRSIVKAIAPNFSLTPALGSPREIDDQLLALRGRLAEELGRNDIDFYEQPLHAMWTDSAGTIATPKVAEPNALYDTAKLQQTQNHWLVGAYWEELQAPDLTAIFVAEGRWENGYQDRFLDDVKAVRPGDRIAIKTAYVQRHNLPFDNQGRPVSCMQIKARGVVAANPGDGRNLSVQWEANFKPFVVYHYTYRRTITAIDAKKHPQVIRWIFAGEPQPLGVSGDLASLEDLEPRDERDDTELRDAFGAAPRNVILYGPPGTGKTRALLEMILPAYTDDPQQETDSERLERLIRDLGWFEVIGVAVLQLAKPTATVPQIRDHPWVQAKFRLSSSPSNPSARIWSVLQSHTVQSSTTVRYASRVEPLVFDKSDAAGWSLVADWARLAPEIAWAIDQWGRPRPDDVRANRRYEMVTFHPSYSYEDFVEGLRPVPVEREGGETTIEIQPMDGALKRICDRARRDPDRRYALVIDEINRGNIAKIFGELITLIEADKRTRHDSSGQVIAGVQVRLPYSPDPFGVPENVDLYGTMNTADRSIALVDIALRRRFLFRELAPDPSAIAGARGDGLVETDDDGEPIDLRRLLRVLNARLTVLRGRDACIGHAYLTGVTDIASLRAAFRDRIVPLLQEHFFEDWGQLAHVLAVPRGSPAFVRGKQPSLGKLFGDTADISDLVDRPIWSLSPELPASAFRALYEGVSDDALDFS